MPVRATRSCKLSREDARPFHRWPAPVDADALGVGHSPFPSGISDNPDAVAPVRGADGGSWNTVPLRVIPERGKVLKHVPESFRPESRHVLQQDIAGSKVPNEAGHRRPEPARVVLREPLAGEGDGLAGESGSDEIDSRSSLSEKSHIPEVGHVRPVSGEDAAGEGVDLGEPLGSEASGALEAEVDPSDACKEGADPKRRRCCSSSSGGTQVLHN